MRKLLSILLVLFALLACADRLVSFHPLPRHEVTTTDRSMGVPEAPSAPHALVAGAAVVSHTTAAQDFSAQATWPVYWSAPVIVSATVARRTARAPAHRRLFPLLI